MTANNLAFTLNLAVGNLITHNDVKKLKNYLERDCLKNSINPTQDTIILHLIGLCNELIKLDNNQMLSTVFDKTDKQDKDYDDNEFEKV